MQQASFQIARIAYNSANTVNRAYPASLPVRLVQQVLGAKALADYEHCSESLDLQVAMRAARGKWQCLAHGNASVNCVGCGCLEVNSKGRGHNKPDKR